MLRSRHVRPAGPVLVWSVQAIDAWLRRYHHIEDFTDNPRCILRIALGHAQESVKLASGTVIAQGARYIELHLWNEHLPRAGEGGPDLTWAALVRERYISSLGLLARYMSERKALGDVVAIKACIHFPSQMGRSALYSIARRLGFEVVPQKPPATWGERLHLLLTNLFHSGMVRVFNPGMVRGDEMKRLPADLWVERRVFEARFAPRSLKPSSRAYPAPSLAREDKTA